MKISFAVAMLLASCDQTEAMRSQQSVASSLDEMSMEEATATPEDIFDLEEDAMTEASFRPTACDSGLKRTLYGKSNSWDTFEKASSGSSKWEDPEFPADHTSMAWDRRKWGQAPHAYAVKANLPWKRIPDIYGGSTSLYGKLNKPVPNGVGQGELGDCWYLAAVSAVAEVPNRITDLIYNQEYSKNGVFRVNFHLKNEWISINIDDRIPVKHNQPYGTKRTANGAWWMPIMEKAFAKMNLNYDRIQGGLGFEGLRHLTGMPSLFIDQQLRDKNKLLPIHKYFAEKNFPMTAGCCRRVRGGIHGLISGHAYTLLDVKDLKDTSGNVKHTLAKVRNPWAKEMYKGPWKDDDSRWTEHYKKQVNLVKANDGAFWMPYDNYINMFTTTGVSLYQPYQVFQMDVVAKNRYTQVKFNNPVAQHLYITGDGYNPRIFPRKGCDPKNDLVLLLQNSQRKRLGHRGYAHVGQVGSDTIGELVNEIPAGEYTLIMINQTAGRKDQKATIHFYATKQQIKMN